jgi:hypothetical protein
LSSGHQVGRCSFAAYPAALGPFAEMPCRSVTAQSRPTSCSNRKPGEPEIAPHPHCPTRCVAARVVNPPPTASRLVINRYRGPAFPRAEESVTYATRHTGHVRGACRRGGRHHAPCNLEYASRPHDPDRLPTEPSGGARVGRNPVPHGACNRHPGGSCGRFGTQRRLMRRTCCRTCMASRRHVITAHTATRKFPPNINRKWREELPADH